MEIMKSKEKVKSKQVLEISATPWSLFLTSVKIACEIDEGSGVAVALAVRPTMVQMSKRLKFQIWNEKTMWIMQPLPQTICKTFNL